VCRWGRRRNNHHPDWWIIICCLRSAHLYFQRVCFKNSLWHSRILVDRLKSVRRHSWLPILHAAHEMK
jgi:hypothetical protein